MTAAEIAARYGATLAEGVTIQKVETGVSGLPQPYWCPKTKQLVYGLTFEQRKDAGYKAKQRQFAAKRAREARSAAQEERANRMSALVRDHFERGVTAAESAAQIGVSERTVLKYRATMGLRVKVDSNVITDEAMARVRLVKQLCAEGLSIQEISVAIPCYYKTVSAIMRAHGFTRNMEAAKARKASKPIGPPQTEMARKVVDLADQGFSWGEILRMAGCSSKQLSGFIAHYGLNVERPDRIVARRQRKSDNSVDVRLAARDARRKKVREMRGNGSSLAQMAKALGASEASIVRDLHALGLANYEDRLAKKKERLEKVKEMRLGGATAEEIAEVLGRTVSLIWNDLKALGIKRGHREPSKTSGPGRKRQLPDAQRAAIAAREARVAELLRSDPPPSIREVARIVGASPATVIKDARKAGIITSGKALNGPKRTAWLVADKIHAMRADGASIAAITEEVGFSRSAVQRVLRGH